MSAIIALFIFAKVSWISPSPLLRVSNKKTFYLAKVSVDCFKYFYLSYKMLFSFFITSFWFSRPSICLFSWFIFSSSTTCREEILSSKLLNCLFLRDSYSSFSFLNFVNSCERSLWSSLSRVNLFLWSFFYFSKSQTVPSNSFILSLYYVLNSYSSFLYYIESFS